MQLTHRQNFAFRASSLLALGGLVVPLGLAGCGSPAPPQNAAPISQPRAQQGGGMTTGQKVKLLAGAAALYYLYNRYKKQNEARLAGQNVQYYLSKNGRVYYRDPKNPQNVIWVTPPPQQVQTLRVPESEAAQFSDLQNFQGYPGGNGTKTLRDYFPVQ